MKAADWQETGKVAELQKSNFKGPQSQFRNLFLTSTLQLIWLSAILQCCGGADLDCECPSLIFTVLHVFVFYFEIHSYIMDFVVDYWKLQRS